MSLIKLSNVILDIPIFDTVERSLRTHAISALSSGKILKPLNKKLVVRALNQVNLEIREGDAVGLVGANGSGKSSLLRLISGIYMATSGSVSVTGWVRPLISLGVGLEPNLNGVENIRRLGALYGYQRYEIEEALDEIVTFSGLREFIELPVRTYSSGMVLRLMFSTLVTGDPDILVLDEFFSAGDEEFITQGEKRMEALLGKAKILVFASHSKSLIKKYCNRFVRMKDGYAVEIEKEEI